MASVVKPMVNFEGGTENVELSKYPVNSTTPSGHLIAIHRRGRLVKIFRPHGKNISIGRSSRCDLTLPDPRFPREAGEIVLGPVPIFRNLQDRNKMGQLIPLLPGKSFRIGPYNLTLLEPGDILFNKLLISKTAKNTRLKQVCLTIGTGTFGMFFLLGNMGITLFREPPSPAEGGAQRQVEDTDDANKPKDALMAEVGSKVSSSAENDVREYIAPRKAPPSHVSLKKIPQVVQNPNSLKLKLPSLTKIQPDELKGIIKRVAEFIDKEDLKTAGRILAPFLPHIDNEQRNLIVSELDPAVQKVFRKAYMLKSYQPEKSRAILMSIADSGLYYFPGYLKARKMLEREGNAITDFPNIESKK